MAIARAINPTNAGAEAVAAAAADASAAVELDDVSADAADGNADEGETQEADDGEMPDNADIAIVAAEPSAPPRRSGRGSQARGNSKDQSGATCPAETANRRPRRVWDVPSAANGADDVAPSAPASPR